MQIDDSGNIVPTPLVPIYFDHEAKEIHLAFGIDRKRARELERHIEDMMDDRDGKSFGKISLEMEETIKFAKNEQERIFMAMNVGRRNPFSGGHGKSGVEAHVMRISGSDIRDMLGDEGIEDLIKKFLKKRRDEEE